jgi:TonB family protein
MNAQTGLPSSPAHGTSEKKMSMPARGISIRSLIASAWVLPIWAALLCVQGIAQQATANQNSPGPGGQAAPPRTLGNMEVLSDTQGVDFGPDLSKVLDAVRRNWYILIPEEAKYPLMKRGKLAIEFAIMPDGKVAGMKLASPSGDVSLDRAAWGGITASNPFAPLPEEFHGPYLALRFRFYYNPQKSDMPESNKAEAH